MSDTTTSVYGHSDYGDFHIINNKMQSETADFAPGAATVAN